MIDYVYVSELKRYEKALKKYSINTINHNQFKSDVIESNLPSLVKSVNKKEYEFIKRDLYVDFSLRDWLSEKYGFCKVLEAYRLNESYKKRIQRLKNKISNIFDSGYTIYFLTFTFTDDTLKNTSSLTRRRYVQRFLTSYTYDYVGNIDFGEEKGREHYHALVSAKNIDSLIWFKKYGVLRYEIVKFDKNKNIEDTKIKLAKYINKFINHALKESTTQQHLLYKREKRSS